MRKAGAFNPNYCTVEIIMYEVYLWADGRKFDVVSFKNALPSSLRGTAELRKRAANGVREYWKSEVKKNISNNPEAELLRLLVKYKSALLRARKRGANRVSAEIVVGWQSLEEISGFYFSDKMIRLLSEIGASVDIDIYERFSQSQRFTMNYDVGDAVKLMGMPGWVGSLPQESQDAFKACINNSYRIIDITLDGHLVLDISKDADKLLRNRFNDIRVDPKYVAPVQTKKAL